MKKEMSNAPASPSLSPPESPIILLTNAGHSYDGYWLLWATVPILLTLLCACFATGMFKAFRTVRQVRIPLTSGL